MSDEHPETRLLGLIKGGGAPASAAPGKRKFSPMDDLSSWMEGVDPFRAANGVLAMLLMVAIAIAIAVFIVPRKGEEGAQAKSAPLDLNIPKRFNRPFSKYSAAINSRMLFGTRKVIKEGPSVAQLSKGLSLQGFMGDGKNLEAIVSDSRQGSTHYLKKGDSIRGFRVKSLGGGRVVLDIGGRTVTLRQ